MNLSKTKYCNGLQCKKILWLLKNKPEEKGDDSENAIMDSGNDVHEIARDLFKDHINIEYNDNLNKMLDDTKKALEKDNVVITEASFMFDNNFCSVDILKKNKNKYEIYEVKGTKNIKDVFLDDISYQYYVLSNLGLNVTKCSLVLLNSDYIRGKELDINKLFVIEDVTKEVISRKDKVKTNIDEMRDYMNNPKEPGDEIDNHCFNPYDCPFFKYCTKDLPENNVFDIRIMYKKEKIKLYKRGIYSFKDILKEDIDELYKKQIRHELNNLEDEVDKKKIKEFMKTLSYPLYFLDFETMKSPIPMFEGSSPNEQIPFQYSLHYIEEEGGELKHKEFLSEVGIDPRRKLAEALVKDIPMNVCTLAYNMMFEKSVIKRLADNYPDLRKHLMNIFVNIKDLMIPFKERSYYNKAMKGSYSIKYVLPALFPDDEKLDYHNLDLIQNGKDAMTMFADLVNKPKKEQEYIRERLLRYCELDTYAMVKVYFKLKEVIER